MKTPRQFWRGDLLVCLSDVLEQIDESCNPEGIKDGVIQILDVNMVTMILRILQDAE